MTYVNTPPILMFILKKRKAGEDLCRYGTDSSPTCSPMVAAKASMSWSLRHFSHNQPWYAMCDFVRLFIWSIMEVEYTKLVMRIISPPFFMATVNMAMSLDEKNVSS